MRLKAISIFTVLFFLFTGTGMGQIDTTWTKIYGGDRDDKAYDIISTADSGYLVIGSTSSFGFDNSQMYFLKLDSTGAIMWSKSHGGSNQEAGHAVIQTQDGGYVGVGYTNSWGSGGFDLLMVKLDANGNTIFEKYFGGTDWDFAWDVLETQPNVFVMAGETQSFGSGGKDAWIVRYDASNDIFDWNKTIGGSSTDDYKAITPDPTGGFYTAGRGVQTGHPHEDVMVTRFDANGDTIWNRYYGDTLQDYANDITLFTDSSVVFTGRLTTTDTVKTYVVKLSPADTTIWEDRLKNTKNAIGFSVIERPDGYPAVISQINSPGTKHEFWYVFMGYNGSGTMGTLENDYATAITLDHFGKYMMAGYSNGFNSNFTNILLYKTKEGMYNPNNLEFISDTMNVVSVKKIYRNNSIRLEREFHIIRINQNNESLSHLNLFDISGKKVFSNSYESKTFQFNTESLNKGIYFLRITNSENNFSKTFKIAL